jgi:hypothetical protein
MSALNKIRQAGFSLSVVDGKLLVTPAKNLTDQQREFIKRHKAEIIDYLEREAAQRYFGFLITRPDGSQFFSYSVPFINMQDIRIQYHNAAAIEPVTNEVYPND